jgi:hypothetical protein
MQVLLDALDRCRQEQSERPKRTRAGMWWGIGMGLMTLGALAMLARHRTEQTDLDPSVMKVVACHAKIVRFEPGVSVSRVEVINLQSGETLAAKITDGNIIIFECPSYIPTEVLIVVEFSDGTQSKWTVQVHPLLDTTLVHEPTPVPVEVATAPVEQAEPVVELAVEEVPSVIEETPSPRRRTQTTTDGPGVASETPKPAQSSAPTTLPPTTTLSTKEVLAQLAPHSKTCGERHPEVLLSKAEVRLQIDPNGKVAVAEVMGSLRNTRIAKCIVQAVSGIGFPPSTDGFARTVSLPLRKSLSLQ